MPGLETLLITLIVLAVIFGILIALVKYLPINPDLKMWIRVGLALLAIVIFINRMGWL